MIAGQPVVCGNRAMESREGEGEGRKEGDGGRKGEYNTTMRQQ